MQCNYHADMDRNKKKICFVDFQHSIFCKNWLIWLYFNHFQTLFGTAIEIRTIRSAEIKLNRLK